MSKISRAVWRIVFIYLISSGKNFQTYWKEKSKGKKSLVHEWVPSFLRKRFIDIIADPLLYLVNKLFEEGEFPQILEINEALPIHEKGDLQLKLSSNCNVSSFSKAFEYCFVERSNVFLSKKTCITHYPGLEYRN